MQSIDCLLSLLDKWQPLAIFLSAIAAIILAIVVVLQDRLRMLFFTPSLDLEEGPFYPDYERVPLYDKKEGKYVCDACYMQIRVKNSVDTRFLRWWWPATAEKVEVYVAKLEKETDGKFHEVKSFYKLNLKWRHYDTIFLERLSSGTARDFTLGRIVDPDKRKEAGDYVDSLNLPPDQSPFRLELAVAPTTRSDLFPPGKYRLLLEISASNMRRPKKQTIELEFSGLWLEPSKMAVARVIK